MNSRLIGRVYIALLEDDPELEPEHRADIASFARVVQHKGLEPATETEKRDACLEVDVAILGRSGGGLTVETVDAVAGRLKGIGVVGGLVSHVSPDRVVERGITLFNCGFAMANSVAEYSLALMLCGLRDIPHMIKTMQVDGWGAARAPVDLAGRQIGLVGFGMIGQRVAELLKPFDTTIRVYDPYCEAGIADDYDVELCDLEVVLGLSEVVSIHAGRTDETKGLIDAKALAAMPDGALLVNTARAAIVDEDALVCELGSGRLRAALNVYWREPLSADHPLRGMPNVILTPHGGGKTHDRFVRQGEGIVEDVRRALGGESPLHEVTAGMLTRMT